MDAAQIEEIIELVRRLAPEQRRQLQRRLRASGLWQDDAVLTDRNRLEIAPAVHDVSDSGAGGPDTAKTSKATVSLRMVGSAAAGPRSPGKVVLGGPSAPAEGDPHGMAALPGQAPERPIAIVFDGGSKGNPGFGYGSYALRWPGQPQQLVQLQFGHHYTNNEAEYDTLIAALEGVLKRLQDANADPATARLDIRGDSQLVINQVLGTWKCTEDRLRRRRDHVRELLQQIGSWQLVHHARENSVRVLGH